MNQWTREFCRAHGFRISQKTKYFISDCKGPGDPRWLATVDGEANFYPKPPDTEFRYLGVFMSLNLTSATHIDYMTKTINTWKWKARTEKIDPAQLTTTVTELLLPKLELGLLYSYGITEQMCNTWTNTIIQTIFQDAHMGKMTTRLLPNAFTSLTGIPRLWDRLKTLRITEFFVATNSKNCSNGSSTVARLCALKKKQSNQLPMVIEGFQKATKQIRGRRYNRLGLVVKWLKEANLVLTSKPEDKTDILSQ